MKKIIMLVVILFLTCGCFDYQELNNLNVVTGIGFDMVDGEYLVSLEVTKIEESDKSGQKVPSVFKAQDKDLATAIARAINNSDKKTYFKHVNVVLISEEIAKDGISPIIDYLLRESNMSTTFFTAITKDAYKLFATTIDKDTVSNVIVSTITSHVNAEILNNIDIITSNILNKRRDIALPYVELENEEKIIISEKAYFGGDRMIDKIDNKIYNFLYLGNKNTVFDNDGNVLNVYDKKVSYEVFKDKIIVKIEGKGKIVSLNEGVQLKTKGSFSEIEKMINEKIIDETEDFLEETLRKGADLMGFKDWYYKKYKVDVDGIPFEIESNITLVRNGTIMEVIHD